MFFEPDSIDFPYIDADDKINSLPLRLLDITKEQTHTQ